MGTAGIQILIAIITVAGTLIGVLAQTRTAYNKMIAEVEKSQAVMNTKIEHLTEEVRKHNDFARRMPVLEEKVENLEEAVKEIKVSLKDDGR